MNEPFEGFWNRLKMFVENVEVNDAMSEEEKGMILHTCKEKMKVKNLAHPDVSGSVAFAKWIGERMIADSWFRYGTQGGKWYVHTKGHLTTEELYAEFEKTKANVG